MGYRMEPRRITPAERLSRCFHPAAASLDGATPHYSR